MMHFKAKKTPVMRKCVVSGKVLPKKDLIRFVIDPHKFLVPDIEQKLPGRGFWIQAKRTTILKAQKKTFLPLLRKKPFHCYQTQLN